MKSDSNLRYRVLSVLHSFCKGTTSQPVIAYKVAQVVNIMPAEQFIKIVMELNDDLLVILNNQGALWMTPLGIEEVENRRNQQNTTSGITQNTTNIHGSNYGGIQQGGQNNTQNITVTNNPEFDKAIAGILEVIKSASINNEDKEELLADVKAINNLALKEPSPNLIERAKSRINLLEASFKAVDLAIKVAPYMPQIYAFFENLSQRM